MFAAAAATPTTHLTFWDILGVGGVAGVATAAFNGLFGLLGGRLQRTSEHAHQTDSQKTEINHRTRSQIAELDHQSQLQHSEQEHQRQMQADRLTHEARLRAQQEHAAARDRFISSAADIAYWVDYSWGSAYGISQDYTVENQPLPAFLGPPQVIKAIWDIEYQHPTPLVRELALKLDQAIAGHYGEILPRMDRGEVIHRAGGPPTEAQYEKWKVMANELVEALHAPPPTM